MSTFNISVTFITTKYVKMIFGIISFTFPERNNNMKQNIISKNGFIRLCIAFVLCFVAVYFSELRFGAVATVPFILFSPAAAYAIHRKPLHIICFCALSAFILKCLFYPSVVEVLLFVVFCSLMGAVSILTLNAFWCYKEKRLAPQKLIAAAVLFVISLAVYILIYGTFFGNISSKKLNTEYLESTYPKEDIAVGSTYFSVRDMRYVTEFTFTAKERYRAKVSADKDGNAVIDGYRDLVHTELLDAGMNKINRCLSTFAYIDSDYSIRPSLIDTDDTITAKNVAAEYYDAMCFEIGLRYQFASSEDFEKMCRDYISHLNGYESLIYKKITFYGFGTDDKTDFEYALEYTFGSDSFESTSFSAENFKRYYGNNKYYERIV